MSFLVWLVSNTSRSLKNKLGTVLPSQPLRKQFLHEVWVLLHGYLCVRFYLPSSINFRDINTFLKLGPRTLIRGYPKESRVVPLNWTGIFPISQLHPKPNLAPFPRYSLRHVQPRYIWLPLLRLTPSANLRKILRGSQPMAKVQEGVETLLKILTGWVWVLGTRTLQTDDRQNCDDKYPNVTWSRSGKNIEMLPPKNSLPWHNRVLRFCRALSSFNRAFRSFVGDVVKTSLSRLRQ